MTGSYYIAWMNQSASALIAQGKLVLIVSACIDNGTGGQIPKQPYPLLTHYSEMCDPGKLAESGFCAAYDSIRIRNAANFINFLPICPDVSPNCTIIHQHERAAPVK